jgi:exopolysaccharide biosynthesis polyprenyl glycosylphosphotransferase
MGYFFLAERTFPRSVLVLFIFVNAVLLLIWRLVLQALLRTRERRVVLVGANLEARELARKINGEHWLGLRIMGFVPAPHQESRVLDAGETEGLGPRLGGIVDLPRLLTEGIVDDIILADDESSWQTLLIDRLAHVAGRRGSVLVLPNPYESLIGRMRFRSIQDAPLIEVVRESEWRINRPLKRITDIVLAVALLVPSLPIIGLCALAIRLTSPGPMLYRQNRIGQGRRPFVLWKLRTMRVDAEDENEEILAQLDDPRLIPLGGLLRRLRLDELPQLWNVLNGTMSMVGPRPERPGFVRRYLEEITGYAERFSIPPGLTGLAQINGHYHSTPQTKLRYDLAYLANSSLWLDATLLLRTVRIVLTSRGT